MARRIRWPLGGWGRNWRRSGGAFNECIALATTAPQNKLPVILKKGDAGTAVQAYKLAVDTLCNIWSTLWPSFLLIHAALT
jgi:hypothetical protein